MIGALKRFTPWLITSLISIILIVWSRDQKTTPLQGSVNGLVSLGAYPIAMGMRVGVLWSENSRLRKSLAESRLSESDIIQTRLENERLRRMLEFKEKSEFRLIAAETVGLTTDEGIRGIIINRGYTAGIKENQSVVTPDGLVGRVFRVYETTSTVQVLGDPNFGVAARISRWQESGIIHSNGANRLRLDGIPVSLPVDKGDSVLTSGQGGVFPPGLMIGYATKVSPSVEGWLLNIDIEPSVEIARASEVFVIQSYSSQ